MKRFALVCPLILALACSGDEDPKRGNGLGAGDGTGEGDGDGDGRASSSGDGCEEHVVIPSHVTPQMLIVLDRSGSMKMDGVNRWDPSVAGIDTIVNKLDSQIEFGLMTFPARSGDNQNFGGQQNNCTAGALDAPIKLNNGDSISQILGRTQPGGRTPTAVTLQNVLNVLQPDQADPDHEFQARYVMLVTDGAPNCSNPGGGFGFGGGGGGGTGGTGEPAAIDASVAAVKALAQAGIPTYVLGYDTKNDPQLAAALDRMAKEGDTGDTAHRAIEGDGLLKAFEEIAVGAVSCDYVLDNEVNDPSFVRVELDDQLLNFNDTNGWRLRQDNRTVQLQGSACDTLRSGDGHKFSVVVQCVELF